MRLPFLVFSVTLATAWCLNAPAPSALAQEPSQDLASQASPAFPEAPQPQYDVARLEQTGQQPAPAQSDSGASSSQSQTPQPGQDKSARDKANEQIHEQEHQRVLGIIPQFNTSYRGDAVSLTGKEKIGLAFRSAVDPVAFGIAIVVAGVHEVNDDDTGFGWGAEGYGKRAGAAYLDSFDGTMIGNGILPALFHQDPRYFRLGHGSTTHRLLYAAGTTVMCKGDKTRRWQPNYSNVGGNIIAGAISNLYYPSQNSGAGQTISNGMIVTAEGTLGGIFQEFWPDISRKLFHKDPTHGLDDQARAADAAGKQQKQPLPPPQK